MTSGADEERRKSIRGTLSIVEACIHTLSGSHPAESWFLRGFIDSIRKTIRVMPPEPPDSDLAGRMYRMGTNSHRKVAGLPDSNTALLVKQPPPEGDER